MMTEKMATLCCKRVLEKSDRFRIANEMLKMDEAVIYQINGGLHIKERRELFKLTKLS